MRRPPSHPTLRWPDLWRRSNVLQQAHRQKLLTTYSGRGAIYQALTALRATHAGHAGRKVVLVPAFHCPTVVDPVVHAGFEPRFYTIDERLQVDAADFLGKLGSDVAAAIFIRYFGFIGASEEVRRATHDAGAWLIDDCSHSFLLANPVRLAEWGADATTYSFWKLLPSAAGGGVLFRDPAVLRAVQPQGQPSLRSTVERARTQLEELLDSSPGTDCEKDPQPVIRRSAAEAYPYSPEQSLWRMPAVARRVLTVADLEGIVASRRRNFMLLGQHLEAAPGMQPLQRTLDEQSCPWGFPVLLQRRQEQDYLIRARGVPVFSFGEVLHPLLFAGSAPTARILQLSRFLADSLLVLSIHQNLDSTQVLQSARLVNRFFAENSGARERAAG